LTLRPVVFAWGILASVVRCAAPTQGPLCYFGDHKKNIGNTPRRYAELFPIKTANCSDDFSVLLSGNHIDAIAVLVHPDSSRR
jgi:hypothetical protein